MRAEWQKLQNVFNAWFWVKFFMTYEGIDGHDSMSEWSSGTFYVWVRVCFFLYDLWAFMKTTAASRNQLIKQLTPGKPLLYQNTGYLQTYARRRLHFEFCQCLSTSCSCLRGVLVLNFSNYFFRLVWRFMINILMLTVSVSCVLIDLPLSCRFSEKETPCENYIPTHVEDCVKNINIRTNEGKQEIVLFLLIFSN